MNILCKTTFLDGRDRFEAGEKLATSSGEGCRVITEDQRRRFLAAGWASEAGADEPGAAPAPAEPATLDIHNSAHDQEAPHG